LVSDVERDCLMAATLTAELGERGGKGFRATARDHHAGTPLRQCPTHRQTDPHGAAGDQDAHV
jgi:hypothetical protein